MNDVTAIRISRENAPPTPDVASIPELVSTQAFRAPEALALKHGAQGLTYRDLDERANELAEALRGCGVGPEVVVGLVMPRSPAMVVGALGILKAGGAYLPLNPNSPSTRLALILDDVDISLVVASSTARREFSNRPTFFLDDAGRVLNRAALSPFASAEATSSPKNLAYVIYTSGSTGQPNGVEITRESLSNLVRWHLDAFSVTPADRATHLADVAFDAAVWEVWPHLAAGASVHFPSEEIARDPRLLRDWLVSEKITLSFVPTPLAEYLLTLRWPSGTSLRTMLTGADTLHFYAPAGLPFSLVNNYGPTECTVVATSGIVSSSQISHRLPSIGCPISNTEVYVLDETGNELPPGTPGELYIAGKGLARGYRNRPQLTRERFIPNPADSTERLFKTGDRGKVLPDGQIAFLGRMEEALKVRGFRVEPTEIAAALSRHPEIQQSIVVVRETAPGDARLVAYFITTPTNELKLGELREFLTARLPDYMVPTTFVRLEKLLLTSNGKVDRKSLPEPDENNILRERAPTAPRTEMEKIVADILSHLLKFECVDVEENFFSLGGHSLLGAQLVARIRDRFRIELPLRAVFDAPTVADLSAEIEKLCRAKLDSTNETEDIFASPLAAPVEAMP